jgi:tRNA-dihydrouridine synthase
MIDETGCDLVMVGRAARGNPWIFSEINGSLDPAGVPHDIHGSPGWDRRLPVIREHFDLVVARRGEYRGVREMRKHLGWYIRGLEGAAAARSALMQAETADAAMRLLDELGRLQPAR